MITVLDYDGFKYLDKPINIALGNFDGVHIGHKALISKLIEDSKNDNLDSMVYTFYNHPLKIIKPTVKFKLLTTNHQRIDIFNELGLDYLILKTFDQKTMKMTPDKFINNLLVKRFNVKCVYVGYNYTFGNNAKGNIQTLKKLGEKYNFKVNVTDEVKMKGMVVSSTTIRNYLNSGKIDMANKCLGRKFSISGKVIHGRKVGSRIGIPTANLDYNKHQIIPQNGVYATQTMIDGKIYKSLTNIGIKPTFNSNKLSMETHIIGYNSDLYDKCIDIIFEQKIRDERKYHSPSELTTQIKKDIQYVLEKK
ncbi:MAG: bifunctional riboflavin kinase/FAD synthetase [Clostridia bacterium]|nr:bifunctional riboflavin kinase/FAD synthetase [Clostridia bacterium]